jgi:hypothetical protein
VGGQVGALVWIDRLRGHPVGPRLLSFGAARGILEGTSVDPLKDLERIFVTSPSVNDKRAVMFAEHNLTQDRIPGVMNDLVRKSDPPGQIVADAPFPMVKVQRKGRGGIVAFLPPNFVVAVPEDLAQSLGAFAETGGLPGPEGIEAALAIANNPSETLKARGAPDVPSTISTARALITLRPDGGASVDTDAQSASPQQADQDADALTEEIDRLTSVKLGFMTIRAFDKIVFKPKGDQVVSHTSLSRGQLDQILGLAETFANRSQR